MATKQNKHKRILAGIAVSALALATVIGAVNFSGLAGAVKGSLDTKAEYGEKLSDQLPGTLVGTNGSPVTWGWSQEQNHYSSMTAQ